MATFTPQPLSGGADGVPVKVAQTTSSGTTIHTTSSATDEIWLWAYNSHNADVLLTIQFGGTTSVDHDIKVTIPKSSANPAPGLIQVVPGLRLTNSKVVRAYAETANVVTLLGYVNRIS